MYLLHRLTRTYIVVLAATNTVTTAQFPSPRTDDGHIIDPELSLVMKANAQISRDTELKETWAWLEHLSSKPACTQLATSKLTTECQLLDNPSDFAESYPEQVLEDVQNEYALKLAICEYVGAQNTHPKAPHKCHAFLPSREACLKRSWWGKTEAIAGDLCYPKATNADLQQCLTTMQASPQTWTSYSNARSRAMHICHLTRQHIETERAIQVHRNLTLVVAKMHASVQPLESKMHSMHDQLHLFSDDFRRSFKRSQQAADEFTAFAKNAHTKYRDHLEETNQGLRDMRSEFATSQHHIDEQYVNLQARLADHFETSLASNKEVMAQHQDDSLTQFATTIDSFFQNRAMELSEKFKMHKEELQEYHTKNILALQQHHETTVQSLDILRTGLYIASSGVDGLNDKIGTLKHELDGSIARAEIVNQGLGSLASMAQTAGRFLANIETFVIYVGFGGGVVGIGMLMNCVPGSPLLVSVVRKLIMIALALLICGASSYIVSRSFSVTFESGTFTQILPKFDTSKQIFSRFKSSLCVILLGCTLFIMFKYVFSGANISSNTLPIYKRLSYERVMRQTKLRPTERPRVTKSIASTEPVSLCEENTPYVLDQLSSTKRFSLSRETGEDELGNRIKKFQRACTAPC